MPGGFSKVDVTTMERVRCQPRACQLKEVVLFQPQRTGERQARQRVLVVKVNEKGGAKPKEEGGTTSPPRFKTERGGVQRLGDFDQITLSRGKGQQGEVAGESSYFKKGKKGMEE